ncbi:MAG: M48 family metallopeptidase [Rickettsiales bacterium]|jgi:predicted metal-dependent hydrolase|nr:M48 family metallopeptidase [Rickettsiales bacterium]
MSTYNYETIREKRKTLAIHILPDCSIVAHAPVQATDDEIADFVRRKHLWIAKQLIFFGQFHKDKCNECISGAAFCYLGKQYQIIIKKTPQVREYVELEKERLIVYSVLPKKQARNQEILDNWLSAMAQKQFALALKRVRQKFNDLPDIKMKIRVLKKRWGSFLSPDIIMLNPNLIFAPRRCIEYVITHELCHYYHRDHSVAFFAMLGAKLPNWEKLKSELENIGNVE